MSCRRITLLLTLYWTVLLSALVQQGFAGPTAVCSLELLGDSITSRLQKARLGCTSGTVTASATASALGQGLQIGSGAVAPVEWVQHSCGLDHHQHCWLVICGAQSSSGGPAAVAIHVTFQNLTDTSRGQRLWGGLCITGSTSAVVKDATVSGNSVAGLVVTGSAHMTVSGGNFINNKRKEGPGGALVAAGKATIQVVSAAFSNNSAEGKGNYAGALLLQDHARAVVEDSTFHYNQAYYGAGGALYAGGHAHLTVRSSRFTMQQTTQGGVLQAVGDAVVTLTNCTMHGNWASWGGCIYAGGHSDVRVVGSSLVSNLVTPEHDYDTAADGGACYVTDSARLALVDTVVRNNSAVRFGGGVAMGSTSAELHLGEGSVITGNSARQGGGLYITHVLDNMTGAAHITVRNKAILSDDIGTNLSRLQPLSAPVVPAFVPRLGDNKGLLPVRLKLTGPGGMPGAAAIQAVLDGRPLARNLSNPATGEAVLNINLLKPPGTYQLVFEVMAMNEELNTKVTVTVVDCRPGEVNVTGENACMTCPRGSYSLDPLANECSRCPSGAVCEGGVIVPTEGHWSSSLRSNQIHRCPYPPACVQNHTAVNLQMYHEKHLQPEADVAFVMAQCAEGHEGNLCGRCARGHGQRLSATVSRCRPCASTAQIICLYVLAALASMLVIKCLCVITAKQAVVSARPQTAAQRSGAARQTSRARSLQFYDSANSLTHTAKGPQLTSLKEQVPINASTSSQASLSSQKQGGRSAALPSAASGSGATCIGNAKANVPPGDLLKPFIIYLQWLMIVATVNVDWPRFLLAPFTAVVWLFGSGSMATGLDCLTGNLAMRNVLLGLLMPVALLVLLLALNAAAGYLTARSQQRKQSRLACVAPTLVQQPAPGWAEGQTRGAAVAQTCIIVAFFFLPLLLRTSYGMFACIRLDQPLPAEQQQQRQTFFQFSAVGSFWLLDTDQQCFKGHHLGWAVGVGAPLVFLLCVVVPLAVIIYLYRSRSRLQDPSFLQHFGFLYKSYRESRCYYEGVVAFQTCVVLAIGVFGATLGAAFQCLLLATTFSVVLAMLAVLQPFNHTAANHTAAQSCMCLIFSAQAALVFDLLNRAEHDKSTIADGIGAAVFAVNVVFILSVFWRVLRVVDWASVFDAAGTATKRAASTCSSCGGHHGVDCFGSKPH